MKGDAHKPKVLWRRGLCNDAKQLPDIPGKEMKRWKVWINGFIRLPCTNTVDCCHSSALIARANASLAHRKHRWCSRAKDLQILPGALSTIPDWRFAAIDLEARRHIGLANINKFNFIVIQLKPKRQTHSDGRWTTFKPGLRDPDTSWEVEAHLKQKASVTCKAALFLTVFFIHASWNLEQHKERHRFSGLQSLQSWKTEALPLRV